jgi:hypothetical protein
VFRAGIDVDLVVDARLLERLLEGRDPRVDTRIVARVMDEARALATVNPGLVMNQASCSPSTGAI